MRKLLTALLLIFLMAIPTYGLAGLTRQKQAIFGEKTFMHDITFEKDVLIKGALLGVNQYSNIFYVDSGGSNSPGNYGTTYLKPFATIDFAAGQCTANNGDIIYVMPGYTQSLTAADAIDVDVEGVTIICLGNGDDQPTFTYTGTSGELVIGADNVTWIGGRFIAGTTSIKMAVSIERNVEDATFSFANFVDDVASGGSNLMYAFLDCIDIAGSVTDVEISYNRYQHKFAFDGSQNESSVSPDHFIEMGNDVDHGVRIIGNVIDGYFEVAPIWSDTVDLNCLVADNKVIQRTPSQNAIEFTGAATGMIVGNDVFTDAEATSIDPGSMYCLRNFVTTAIDSSGVLYPAPDDTATNFIGDDNSNNAASTSNVIPNIDGSVFERLEFLPRVHEHSSITITGTTTEIAKISGGYVQILGIWAYFSTGFCSNDTANLTVTYDPADGGTSTNLGTLLAATSTQTTGSSIYVTGDVSDAIAAAVPGTDLVHPFNGTIGEGLIVAAGDIDLGVSGNALAGTSPVVNAYIYFRPIETGTTVYNN